MAENEETVKNVESTVTSGEDFSRDSAAGVAGDTGTDTKKLSPDEKKKVKHDNFTRLATGRTNKVLTALSHLGNCSSRSSYSYSEEEVEKIFGAIQSKVDETRAKFMPKAKKEEETFTL